MPRALVTGVPLLPLPYGLFSVFAPREGGDRWEVDGVQWEALSCEDVDAYLFDPCPQDLVEMNVDALSVDDAEASAFVVYGHYTCNAVGNSTSWIDDRAVAHLQGKEQYAVESALWTGAPGNVPNFAAANGYAAAAAVVPDEAGPVGALAAVEHYLATTYGSVGTIHMSRQNVTFLANQLTQRGGRLYTKLDTPVVAGAGYASDKIVGTGALFGYRSEIFPGVGVLDRQQNNYTSIAQRSYLIGFDPCGLVAAPVVHS